MMFSFANVFDARRAACRQSLKKLNYAVFRHEMNTACDCN